MAKLRFFVLQTVLIAALVALWLYGPLQIALAGEASYFVSAVLAIGGVGLLLSGIGRSDDAERIQDMLPVLAVVAMQAGILVALGTVGQALMSSGDPSKAVGGFFEALSTALYVSIAALTSYLWLKVTRWLVHGE